MKISGIRYFELEELADKPFIDRFGASTIHLLDMNIVQCIDRLRDVIGPITINNWSSGGPFHESGLRVPWTPTGAQLSMHKFGNAFDLKPKNISPMDLHDYLMKHADLYPEIRRIEDPSKTVSWLHVDSLPHASDGILIVEP